MDEEFETNENGTIEYKGGSFGFVSDDGRSSMWGVLDASDEDLTLCFEEYGFEIIGNIHDKP